MSGENVIITVYIQHHILSHFSLKYKKYVASVPVTVKSLK